MSAPINFVFVSGQSDTAAVKRKVRSHAARNATVRRQKVIAYQTEKCHQADNAQGRCQGPWEPMGFLSPLNPQTILSAARNDPFQSFKRPTTRFESFLLDHFVHQIVLSSVTRLCVQGVEVAHAFRSSMANQWVQLAAADPGILSGVLMAACRSLSTTDHGEIYKSQLLAYKNDCIRLLRMAIESEGADVSDGTIVKTLALASDALTAHDNETSIQHFRAVETMIRLRGGIRCVALTMTVKKLVIWYIGDSQEPNTLLNPCNLSLSLIESTNLPTAVIDAISDGSVTLR